jgi:hypothetical protein
MAILTTSGRTALAAALANETLHLAWGSGNAAWDENPEVEPIDAIALVNEVGRRKASLVTFCVEDEAGDIIVPTGRFQSQAEPSNNLYLRFSFDFSDAENSIIREAAIFSGTVVQAGLPAGQFYFTPGQVTDPGTLIALERFPAITRSGAVRQSFEFVLTL